MKMRLSNSDYWDLFLCYDCVDGQDNNQILSDCILIDIDINNNNSYSGNTLYSLTTWTGATINGSGITLNDIGLTGIDNGLITYNCNTPTSGQTFLSAFTGSTLLLTSADTRFSMNRVTGCTYQYPITIETSSPKGRHANLCGGFYQGFFKLSDRTYFKEISDNKFVWPLEWFRCPPVCSGETITDCCGTGHTGESSSCIDPNKAYQCYLDLKPVPYNYQILPDRLGGLNIPCLDGWTATFWLNKKSTSCSGNTLNNLNPNNKGFFFYMGTRSENKFWNQFSGETGYTTSSGYPLPPPIESKQVLNDNPFLVYTPKGCGCFSGITTEIISEKDRNLDIIDNALGFRIKDDGSIGFRSVVSTGVCSAVTATTIVDCHEQCGCCSTATTTSTTVSTQYITGASINECYSESNLITPDKWTHIAIRFKPYEQYTGCILETLPKRKGQLTVYVDGYLKWTLEDFDEFIFKDLDEYREKQQGVPFTYSWGGGTQGLIESNTVNGPDLKDKNLFLQNNFAGTFEGKVSTFKLYGCSLDVTTIRKEITNVVDFVDTNYSYDSSTNLSWPTSSVGYTLYTSGFTSADDGFTISPILLPTSFSTNGLPSTNLYVSTNGYFTIASGGSSILNGPTNSNPATMAANPGDNWLQTGTTMTDGDVQNVYYETGTSGGSKYFVKLLVYGGTYGATTSPTSWIANFYRDSLYQWLEVRAKSTLRGSVGPYNSTSVAQPSSTTSKVWRGDLNGQNWVYLGTGSVI